MDDQLTPGTEQPTPRVGTPPVDPALALVEAARAVSPVLLRDADTAERESRLTHATAQALREAGMFRLGVPKSLGGHELPVTGCVDVLAEIALACPSSAWIVMLSYGAQQIAASFGDKARSDLWGESPDVPMCGVFSGAGATAEPVEGGLLVSGRWPWASGCHHAEWGVLGVPRTRHGDSGPGGPGVALVPVGGLTTSATWDMAGMRGTGSDTLVADRVFVPYDRIRGFSDVMASGPGPANRCTASRRDRSP
ncbi:acyl-CoA dehydrogenase family protein [Streptomyces sp. ITFR-16]|uniref:acyl-CoA dehydrogenase family protein n=1 Tax=Streptomyces sp. ITFR-16 TaxID=3075198 RepID=UPI00288C0DF3|nr:acyl-CoA dehydrogenase family protein [Streptomyces sp. ITFR-16]WNI26645.1 acyl-CoA dehydrogenase family protein [Streptomyces sp. ITFR-16]